MLPEICIARLPTCFQDFFLKFLKELEISSGILPTIYVEIAFEVLCKLFSYFSKSFFTNWSRRCLRIVSCNFFKSLIGYFFRILPTILQAILPLGNSSYNVYKKSSSNYSRYCQRIP